MNKFLLLVPVLSISACALASGDSDEALDEDLGLSEAELGESSCASAAPDFRTLGHAEASYTSPTTYDHPNCDRAQIVQVDNHRRGYTSRVSWHGLRPATQSSCESAVLEVDVYEGTIRFPGPTLTWTKIRESRARGVWSGTACRVPQVTALEESGTGIMGYRRFAISARPSASSTTTRAFRYVYQITGG
jgi:hypothetical protein